MPTSTMETTGEDTTSSSSTGDGGSATTTSTSGGVTGTTTIDDDSGSESKGTESEASTGTGGEAAESTGTESEASESAGTGSASSESTGAEGGSSESTDGDPTRGDETYTIAGTVARLDSAPIAEGNDGIGTLYIAAFAECHITAMQLGGVAIPDADLSSEAFRVEFAVGMLPAGTVHFALFLDDDLNAILPGPTPSAGDPSFAEDISDGILDCIPVEITDADVTDVELVLNRTH